GGVFVLRDGRAFYHPDACVADAWHGSQERYKRIARLLATNTDAKSFVIFDDSFTAEAVDWYLRAGTPPTSLDAFAITPDQDQVNLLFLSKTLENVSPPASFAFIRDAPLPPPAPGYTGKIHLYMAMAPHVGQLDWSPAAPLATTQGLLPHTLLGAVRSLDHMRLFAEDSFWMCPARPGREGEAVFRFASPAPFAPGMVYLVVDARMHRPGNRFAVDARFDDGAYRQILALDGATVDGPLFLRIPANAPFRDLDVRLRPFVSGDRADRIDGPLEQVRLSAVTVYVPPEGNRFHSRTLEVAEQGLEAPMPDGAGGLVRWGRDVSSLSFGLDRPGKVVLGYSLDSPLPGQRGTVSLNGAPVAALDLSGGTLTGELSLDVAPGQNTVTIAWELANRGSHVFAPGDARPLAARYRTLWLDAAP
ncbi:MAG TPA: hypothetical protein VN436_16690, partial [Holophaga sp.]|nr:hypothetical protein [Holophaga sp.]